MGACGSSQTPEQKAALERSKDLDKQNAEDYRSDAQKIKLLLLGAGESGKSTIFKQFKVLYGAGFSEAERRDFLPKIHMNTITAMKALCNAVATLDDLGAEMSELTKISHELMADVEVRAAFTDEIAAAIKLLWADEAIQKAWARRAEFQVIESNELYMHKIDQIKEFDYVPTDEDILTSRVKTSGIIEENYVIDDVTFVVIDVGGQHNERKKWIHAFDSVNAVIFVAAISEFDQMLYEDELQNRMVDTLHLFEDICNNKYFKDTAMILYLNKRDLFEKKIKTKNIADVPHFHDYKGRPYNYDDGVQYFLEKFLQQNRQKTKDIYHHITCATDSENIHVVFNACKDIILKANLEASGFM